MFIPYLCCLFPEQHFSEEQDIRMSTCFCFCSDTGLRFPLGNDADPVKLTHPSRRLSETGRKYRMRELFIRCRCTIWTSLPACLSAFITVCFFKIISQDLSKIPPNWERFGRLNTDRTRNDDTSSSCDLCDLPNMQRILTPLTSER